MISIPLYRDSMQTHELVHVFMCEHNREKSGQRPQDIRYARSMIYLPKKVTNNEHSQPKERLQLLQTHGQGCLSPVALLSHCVTWLPHREQQHFISVVFMISVCDPVPPSSAHFFLE